MTATTRKPRPTTKSVIPTMTVSPATDNIVTDVTDPVRGQEAPAAVPPDLSSLPHPPLVPVDHDLIRALEERNAQRPLPATDTRPRISNTRPIGDTYFTEKEVELLEQLLDAQATKMLAQEAELEEVEEVTAILRIVKSKWALPTDLSDREATMLKRVIETATLSHTLPLNLLVASGKALVGLALKARAAYGVEVRAIILAPSLTHLPDASAAVAA